MDGWMDFSIMRCIKTQTKHRLIQTVYQKGASVMVEEHPAHEDRCSTVCDKVCVQCEFVLSVYLVPAVGPVRWVDEQGDDLGLGQQGSGPPWGVL